MSMDITLTNAYKSYVHGHNSDKGIWGFEPPRPHLFLACRARFTLRNPTLGP